MADSGAYVGGIHVLAATETPGRAWVSDMCVLAIVKESSRQAVVSDVYAIAAWNTVSRQVVVSDMYGLAATLGTSQNFPRISQMAALAAFGTGVPSKDRGRAWSFDFDGHRFYVLDLGEEGTWIYDFTSRNWSRFDTVGYEGLWNARLGVYWEAKQATVVSDRVNSYLHLIDETQPFDESWRPIEYAVTGGVDARNRPYYAQASFRLVASSGELADPLGTTIEFSFSDDQGKNFTTMETITLEPGAYMQEIAWLSLGSFQAPGRIFRVTDAGGLLRIDAATAEIEGLDDGAKG